MEDTYGCNLMLTCMAAGGITIDDGVMIGPNVRIVTDNHDFANRMVLRCKPVHIGRNAWIGVGAIILPGVTIGDNAEAAAFLLGEHAKFITGTVLLIDGGVIAAIRTGEYQLG